MIFDPDAEDYIRRIFAAGSFVVPHVQIAIERFVIGCKSDPSPVAGVSNWAAIKACCLLAGPQTLVGSLIPLRGPAPANWNGNFVENDYDPLLGLKGDGSTKRLPINWASTADPQDNCHAAVWVTEPITVTNSQGKYLAVTNSNGGSARNLGWSANRSDRAGSTCNNGGINSPTNRAAAWPSFFGVSRHQADIYLERVSGATDSVNKASAPPAAGGLVLFGRSNLTQDMSNARIAFYSAGESVTMEPLDNRLRRYLRDIAVGIASRPRISSPHLMGDCA